MAAATTADVYQSNAVIHMRNKVPVRKRPRRRLRVTQGDGQGRPLFWARAFEGGQNLLCHKTGMTHA